MSQHTVTFTGNAASTVGKRRVRISPPRSLFELSWWVAILLVAGLALFHLRDALIFAHYLRTGTPADFPFYKIGGIQVQAQPNGAPQLSLAEMTLLEMAAQIKQVALTSAILLVLVVGLCLRYRLAWLLSLVVCLLLILPHWHVIEYMTKDDMSVRWHLQEVLFVYYCLFTDFALLLAAPVFFKGISKPQQ